MTFKTLTSILLATSILLFTACDSKTNTNTTNVQNSTLQEEIFTETETETDNDGTNSGGDDIATGETAEDGGTTANSDEETTITGSSNDNNTTTNAEVSNDDDNNTTTSTQPSQTTSSQIPSIPVDTNDLKSLTLTVDKMTLNKDENTTLKVMVTYEDGTSKEVTDKVEWVVTPESSVAVVGKILTAKKDNQTALKVKLGSVLSNTVTLDITWVVNGHILPPEPDKAINDFTLLGVDVNANGVRDDVERYIYKRFGKDPDYPKTKTALAMQYAWSTQKVLENPVIESEKYYADALACQSYWMNTKTSSWSAYDYMKFRLKHRVFDKEHLTDKIFNTKERVLRDFEFNKACSGNIFEGSPKTIESCQADILIFGE